MKTEYVVFDKVNKVFLRGTVWHQNGAWTSDINEARRYKNPQNSRIVEMTDLHTKVMNDPEWGWMHDTISSEVEFVSLPVTVEVKPAQHFKS